MLKSKIQIPRPWCSAAGHDPDNFQSVSVLNFPASELRRRNGFAVMFDDNAARMEVLCAKEFFERAGDVCGDALAVGNDSSGRHQVSVRKLSSGGQLMRTPNTLPTPLVT
jgi:hypothetical protein